MFAPGLLEMQQDLECQDDKLATFAMTVYVLGFGVGPLIFSPLSEVYGRTIIYRVCLIIFLLLTAGCALARDVQMLIVFRFLAGCFGAAPIGIGGSIVSDLFLVQERGAAMAVYQLGPILGNLLGPPIGGIIVEKLDWRWVFWIMTMAVGTASQVCRTHTEN